jgi:hypothetical protein
MKNDFRMLQGNIEGVLQQEDATSAENIMLSWKAYKRNCYKGQMGQ